MPEPGESQTRTTLRRVELMFWALIAPEMIIMWAMRQWFGARKLARQWKGWTKTHGYFIQMGGFMLYEGTEAQGILSPERLEDLYNQGKINFPIISEEEIWDRSKADTLSKTLVIGQTTWFMVQCLARLVKGLDITLLELVTVALAFLNGFTCFLWWNKPLDIQLPVPVFLLNDSRRALEEGCTAIPGPASDLSPDNFDADHIPIRANPFSSTTALAKNVGGFIRSARRFILNIVSSTGSWKQDIVKEKGNAGIIYAIFVYAPKSIVAWVLMRLDDMLESSRTGHVDEGQMRVATFYALSKSFLEDLQGGSVVSVLAAAFGAIHGAGWHSAFPSRIEAWIWRFSSIIISISPVLVLLSCVLFWYEVNSAVGSLPRKFFAISVNIVMGIFFFAVPLYMIARLALMAESFAALRKLTPEALAVVQWTTFIPHI